MTNIIEKINTEQVADKLKALQTEFRSSYEGLSGYLKAEPLNVDLEVNKASIVINFDLNEDTDFYITLATEYNDSELVNISIDSIEVDSYEHGGYYMDVNDDDALLIECKRIIHDAVHYKLLSDDDAIKTAFYHEVYA